MLRDFYTAKRLVLFPYIPCIFHAYMVICTLLSTVTTKGNDVSSKKEEPATATNELQTLQCAEELQSGFPRAVRTPENEKFHDLVRCYLTPGDKT